MSDNAAFDASGVARIRLGPKIYGHKWHIDRMLVTTTSVATTTAKVYKNVENAASKMDFTNSGNDDVSETSLDLATLDSLLFVWTGGTPGRFAMATLYGTIDPGRRVPTA